MKKVEPVPVYTVHYLPQPYEVVDTVSAKMSGIFKGEVGDLSPLGKEGAKIGADAVIGITTIQRLQLVVGIPMYL